ncbi:hypothetical protein NDN01_09325 [Sphingomonas sp. QA11]|uniref:hypothetical protein n=1 Tax=Sphingomonas sp. QA11 TaxID=2950605 RepID=UPI00234A95D5|nr:hypothetical protein [Sphingomonas sp. QA11]WCM29070.1 hypothetical protein NDN01_09325 [Sphingomonas sp. QA11]
MMLKGQRQRSPFSRDLERILARFDQESIALDAQRAGQGAAWSWDDEQDVRYAQHDSRLGNVLHIFHREWHGIRAAAGSLPGRKLVIPEVTLSEALLNVLALQIQDENPYRIIFHGFSANMASLIRWLHDAGLTDRLFAVFHGSPAQWWNEVERKFVFEMIDMAQNGYFSGIHIMKNGMELPNAPLFKPLIYNVSPKHGMKQEAMRKSDRVAAFVPGWNNWIKNVFGSAYGASLSEYVDEVWAFASGLELPFPMQEKLIILKPTNREETFERYLASRVTLNVSLIDCHPMVNVEAQSLGRPCVRSDLYLDQYEDHDYVKLVSVGHNNSPYEIRKTVEKVLDMPHKEIQDMVLDYQGKIDALALDRYAEFLKI